MIETDSCSLCAELLGSHELALWPRIAGAHAPSRIIAQNKSCVAMVTIGPIIKGHCLIVPRSHLGSMAAADGIQRSEVVELLSNLSTSVRTIYGSDVIVFEHGTNDNNICKACSIGHAHWHVVPTAVRPRQMLLSEYTWQSLSNPFVDPIHDYLLVGDGRQEYWVSYPEKQVPSQALRKQLLKCLGGTGAWDWRTNPSIELVLATINDFLDSHRRCTIGAQFDPRGSAQARASPRSTRTGAE